MRLYFIINNPPSAAGKAELHAALHTVTSMGKWEVVPVRPEQLLEADVKAGDVIWWHWPSDKLPPEALEPRLVEYILKVAENGTGILLTLGAAAAPAAVGLEAKQPDVVEGGRWRGQAGPYAKRGMMSFGYHPLLFSPNKLGYSIFTWTPTEGEPYWRISYLKNPPKLSVALSCHLFSKPSDRACLWEYQRGKGRIVCLGAYLYFNARRNYSASSVKALIENCIEYVSNPPEEAPDYPFRYWGDPGIGCKREEPEYFAQLPETLFSFHPEQEFERAGVPWLPANPGNHFYSCASRRMLLMGREGMQIDEIWSYPVRLLKELRWAIQPGGGRPLQQSMIYKSCKRFPDAVHQVYEAEHFGVREQIGTSIWKPAACQQLEIVAEQPFQLVLYLSSDMEMMWPVPNGSTGVIHHCLDPHRNALLLKSESKDCWGMVALSKEPQEFQFDDVSTDEVSRLRGKITFPPMEPGMHYLSIAVAGGRNTRGFEPEVSVALPGAIDRSGDHYRKLMRETMEVKTPDEEFNEGMLWAQLNLESFRAVFPNVGRSMTAGFAPSGEGWLSARPGYGWFFGRDALWTALGMLQTGRTNAVSDILRFLAQHQAINGKIIHEVSASGHRHYDAADSNLLYLIVAERYKAWTADDQLIGELLPSLRKALEFSMAMDCDGDGLTENTGVGHGWVEGGGLFGAHVTFYLAGLWQKALECAQELFKKAGDKALLQRIEHYKALARQSIHLRFWDEERQTYHYGLMIDGSMSSADTIMPAAVILFERTDPQRDLPFLRRSSGPDIISDWGARMISDTDPRYNPLGYHIGSVWPLFTGWLGLAQYARGRSLQGFELLRNGMAVYREFSAGSFSEVLHGDLYQEAGVCPQQCWSAAVIMLLFTKGLLGLEAELGGRIRICPDVPPHWRQFEVGNIRWADGSIDLAYRREGLKATYILDGIDKGERIYFAPHLPKGAKVEAVRVNGKPIEAEISDSYGRSRVEIPLGDKNPRLEVEMELEQYIAPLPDRVKLEVGKPSRGFRVIDWDHDVGHVWVELMGASGGKGVLRLVDPGGLLVEEEAVKRVDDETVEAAFRFPESTEKYSKLILKLETKD
jgi:glycogen debranching enzyme